MRAALARLPVVAGWHTFALLVAIAALLLLAALFSLWRARAHSRHAKVVWAVVVIVIPIIGPALWLITAREVGRAGFRRQDSGGRD